MKPIEKPAALPGILIVEDEGIVARDLKRRLERMGYTVLGTVDSGKAAIELVPTLRPQLVLMDIVIQGPLDGIQTAEQIGVHHDVPIIFLTAHSDTATIQRAKRTTPYGYLIKPFEDHDLATAIEMALYRHAAEHRQRLFQRALDTTAVGIVVTAAEADGFPMAEMNPAFQRMTGYAPGEMLQRHEWIQTILQPSDVAFLRNVLTE